MLTDKTRRLFVLDQLQEAESPLGPPGLVKLDRCKLRPASSFSRENPKLIAIQSNQVRGEGAPAAC